MAKAAVNQERGRQRAEFFIALLPALQTAGEHFRHGGVVILPFGGARNLETAVTAAFRLRVLEHDHGADRIRACKVGNIIAFKQDGQLFQTGHALQQLERLIAPLLIGFRA